MKNNKKPVIIVAVVLLLLIIVSVVALVVLKKDVLTGENGISSSISKSNQKEAVVDFELRQLSEEARKLVRVDLSKALRQGDISVDYMAALRKQLKDADVSLSAGKTEKAESYYTDIVSSAKSMLKTLESADSARELNDSTYEKLEKLKYLEAAFANSYKEAVDMYNQGLQELNDNNFEESLGHFKTTNAILEELKEQSVKQVEAQLEAAEKALSEFDPTAARSSFEKVLKIDTSNLAAKEGLLEAAALEDIAAEMKSIKSLQESGENEAALAQVNALLKENPNNSILSAEQKKLETAISESKREAIIERADVAEAKGDLVAAITALEEANAIRSSKDVVSRLAEVKAKEKASRLEVLLETGYNALKAGSFEAAKKSYEEAVALAPKSEEARTGLEKASSLYLANIRYSQNIEAAAKYLREGQIPLAAKFFKDARGSRPSNLTLTQKNEEARIRDALEAQKQPESVRIISDGKTYVSLIGVFAPEQFKEKEITLYPDVYTIKGTRRDHKTVEVEVKVSKSLRPQTVEVICTEKI